MRKYEWKGNEDWVLRFAAVVEKETVHLRHAQVRYKKSFDRRLRKGNTEIFEGDYVWLDVQDGK